MAVRLSVEASRPQRRLTVAFRLLLAVPHFLVGSVVLGSIAIVLIVVAWLAALLTARVPDGLADLLARILQYQARMYGYGQLLLTDVYPPFQLGPVDHPVELDFDEVGTFNRAAVLFRLLLLIPALVVTQIVLAGVTLALFFIWLITLFAGRMPDAAHEALTSSLQYQMRTYAYTGLVTTTYPRGLFTGVSRPARRLLVLFLVIGFGVQSINVATTIGDVSRGLSAARELDERYADLLDAAEAWDGRVQSCELDDCVRGANTAFGVAVDRFQQHVWALDAPDTADDEIDTVSVALDDLRDLLNDTDDPERLRLAVDDALFALDRHYGELYAEVLAG